MNAHKKLVAIAAVLLCAACRPEAATGPKDKKMWIDTNGVILGGSDDRTETLVVWMGDNVEALKSGNSYLPELNADSTRGFYFPIHRKLAFRFRDGDLGFDLGCVESASVGSGSGTERGRASVRHVSASICGEFIDDWTVATAQASEVIKAFKSKNPSARDLRELNASPSELEKMSADLVEPFDSSKAISLLDEREANRYFERLRDGGHSDQLQLNQNTSVELAAFVGKFSVMTVSISKNFTYGGREQLSSELRNSMRYIVSIRFSRRDDVEESTFPRSISN